LANPYSYAQLSFVRQELANRLYDPSQVFWSSLELNLYIAESLRTWNALTSFWRGDFTFSAIQGQTWYDLTSTSQMSNTLRPLTLHDTDLYTIIQYHLLEPAAWNPWTGVSKQFTPDDLLNAVQRRRDELLSITGCTITERLIPAVAGRIQLIDTVIDVRRMAYVPSALFPTQAASAMWPEDTWAEQSFNRNYTITSAGTPFTYLLSTQPPISFDTDRPPAYAGNYDLLTVEAGAVLAVSTPSLLSIPDDWTHVIKWGALADLLSRESNAKDIPRATYCEQRYRLGLAALISAPALLAIRIDNVAMQIDSVRAADLYNTGWQGAAQGPPQIALHAGLNKLALSPIADATPYSLLATVVQNAPVPVADADQVQVARDDLDAVIDYAQHLAAFKQGGDEFTRTMPLFQRFLKQAATYNGKLAELGEYTSIMLDLSQRERDMNPVSTPAGEEAGTTNAQ
jgi:hypothetical protein